MLRQVIHWGMTKKPLRPNRKLLALWRGLDPKQRKRFAALAKSTPGSLRQNAEGGRGISSDLAIRLEKAAARMGLSPLSRADLNEACGRCEYAKFCLKAKLS